MSFAIESKSLQVEKKKRTREKPDRNRIQEWRFAADLTALRAGLTTRPLTTERRDHSSGP